MKLCFWCSIYGVHPPSKAYRPDDEVGAYDAEGYWICDSCVRKYEEARPKKKEIDMSAYRTWMLRK